MTASPYLISAAGRRLVLNPSRRWVGGIQ